MICFGFIFSDRMGLSFLFLFICEELDLNNSQLGQRKTTRYNLLH